MSDLISRQAAIDDIKECAEAAHDNHEWDMEQGYLNAIECIEELPSAQPERRGKWVKDGETYALYKCSACNEICPEAGWANCIKKEQMYKTFKFCPHCGARMESEE